MFHICFARARPMQSCGFPMSSSWYKIANSTKSTYQTYFSSTHFYFFSTTHQMKGVPLSPPIKSNNELDFKRMMCLNPNIWSTSGTSNLYRKSKLQHVFRIWGKKDSRKLANLTSKNDERKFLVKLHRTMVHSGWKHPSHTFYQVLPPTFASQSYQLVPHLSILPCARALCSTLFCPSWTQVQGQMHFHTDNHFGLQLQSIVIPDIEIFHIAS